MRELRLQWFNHVVRRGEEDLDRVIQGFRAECR